MHNELHRPERRLEALPIESACDAPPGWAETLIAAAGQRLVLSGKDREVWEKGLLYIRWRYLDAHWRKDLAPADPARTAERRRPDGLASAAQWRRMEKAATSLLDALSPFRRWGGDVRELPTTWSPDDGIVSRESEQGRAYHQLVRLQELARRQSAEMQKGGRPGRNPHAISAVSALRRMYAAGFGQPASAGYSTVYKGPGIGTKQGPAVRFVDKFFDPAAPSPLPGSWGVVLGGMGTANSGTRFRIDPVGPASQLLLGFEAEAASPVAPSEWEAPISIFDRFVSLPSQ